MLCTSQGLVMAERSHAVIIMALHIRTPTISPEVSFLSFLCTTLQGGGLCCLHLEVGL